MIRKLVLVCALIASPALAAPGNLGGLPRSGFLGAQLAPAGENVPAPMVKGVIPNSTAASLQLRTGDRILRINGTATPDVGSAVAAAGRMKAGMPVSIAVERAGATTELRGRAAARPLESYPRSTVTYGSFAFEGGRIRDILAMPAGAPNAPVVFLLPGYSCASIEPPMPTHAYRALAARLTAAGIGFYRAEKPGMGDSVGGPQCAEINFETELAAFRTAYRHLTDDLHIPRERVIMLGHSLGALEAPLLADERAPRGVAIYGAVLRNWGDYHQQVASVQEYLIEGADPGKTYAHGERVRPVFEEFYFHHKSPQQISREHPELAADMREVLGWDGEEHALGRNWRLLQALSGLNLPAAWRDAKTNVLSLYGGSDIVALFDTDQKMVADIANFVRPGSGTYVEVPTADHATLDVGTRTEARQDAIAKRDGSPKFDEGVAQALIGWINGIMAKPPVS
jgi:dienelactone hydrolase